MEHNKEHKLISYMDIIPNIDNIKNKIKELKDIIDRFSENINKIIDIIKNIKMNIEEYYIINKNILNNYNIKKRNYEIFNNLNNINNITNNIIIKDIKEIINEKDIRIKFNKIYNLNEKIEDEMMKKEIKNALFRQVFPAFCLLRLLLQCFQ